MIPSLPETSSVHDGRWRFVTTAKSMVWNPTIEGGENVVEGSADDRRSISSKRESKKAECGVLVDCVRRL